MHPSHTFHLYHIVMGMSINEIWVPGSLAVVFLLLPLLRPFINGLWSLDGLVWLPLVALGIFVGIFPAYGFRPEVIPLLILAAFFNLANLRSFIRTATGPSDDSPRETGPFRAIIAMFLLAVAAVPMFVFAPQVYAGHERETEPARSLAVPGGVWGREYVLRVYGPVLPNRPLVFLVPPDIGSAASVELVSERLRDKGFTVVTYFRGDHDTLFIDEDRRRRSYPTRLLGHWRVFRRAADFASTNERGRAMEATRRDDLEFLLPRLPALLGAQGEMPPILFVGYGAGGSALAYMAGEGGFLEHHGDALGVIAVESRLWSSFQNEPRIIEPLTDTGAISRLRTNVANWFYGRRRPRVSRTGPLPEAGLPVLYLVSGRALEAGRRQYQAVFDALHSGDGPVALAAIESAGPLDFQDFPLTQPMVSFFLSGMRGAGRNENPVGDTAGIIGNFASFLLERRVEYLPVESEPTRNYEYDTAETGLEAETPVRREIDIPPRSTIRGSLHIQSRGLPAFQL